PAAPAALSELVEHSLVQVTHTDRGARYRMLETLRERARADLAERGATAPVQERHAAWAAQLADAVGAAVRGTDQALWLDRAEADHANLLAALETWHAGHPSPGRDAEDLGLRIATGLAWFWEVRGHVTIGRDHLDRLLARPGTDPLLRARALEALGDIAIAQADYDTAWRALTASIALFTQCGDTRGAARSASTAAGWKAFAGDLDGAVTQAQSVLACAAAMDDARRPALFALALARWSQDRVQESRELFDQCLASMPAGVDAWQCGRLMAFVGLTALADGDDERAFRVLREGALLFTTVGDYYGQADCLYGLACHWGRYGDHQRVLQAVTVARRLWTRSGAARHSYFEWLAGPAEADARTALGVTVAERVTAAAEQLSVADLLDAPIALDTAAALDTPAAAAVPTSVDGPPPLTSREEQVAALVAAGMTNGQIGRRLGISARTAERHVENLRGKLGVANRAQVAAWVARAEVPTAPAPPR
ncbi:MAG TPA: LuxR C-terminal-related transcriptional regulator, partial [Kineosporiaceae bacterium]|nr:LuxR C-terminal-related transcriptional regulator [Kineosporiaceae bacterium]